MKSVHEGNSVVLLFSGGIDSTVLLYKLIADGYSVYPLHIDYGQITVKGEIAAITSILNGCNLSHDLFRLNVPDIARIGAGTLIGEYPKEKYDLQEWYKKEFFPNRNLMLLTFAAIYCYKIAVNHVAIGITGERSYADTSAQFIDSMNQLFSQTLYNIKVFAPYSNTPRHVLMDEGLRLHVPFDKTFSCNVSSDHHCLFCTSCADREIAFKYIQGK